jgi:ubiquinone/menaquinone biosynthesis C-methylase UbiE
MEPFPHEIVEHYEGVDEDARLRSGINQLEFLRVQEILRQHLPAPPANVVDVGGATGVHAEWLARDGYRVHLVDVTPGHVEQAARTLAGLGVTAEVGDARRLPHEDDSFDVVLLFGPLYHLTQRDERLLALREAARVVRPGGLVAVAAVSRFASLLDGMARGFVFDPQFRDVVSVDLDSGQHRNPTNHPNWWTTAYFHRPEDLRDEAVEAGLKVIDVLDVEGMAAYLPDLESRWDDQGDRDVILWCSRVVQQEPALLGLGPHLLLVASTPE